MQVPCLSSKGKRLLSSPAKEASGRSSALQSSLTVHPHPSPPFSLLLQRESSTVHPDVHHAYNQSPSPPRKQAPSVISSLFSSLTCHHVGYPLLSSPCPRRITRQQPRRLVSIRPPLRPTWSVSTHVSLPLLVLSYSATYWSTYSSTLLSNKMGLCYYQNFPLAPSLSALEARSMRACQRMRER